MEYIGICAYCTITTRIESVGFDTYGIRLTKINSAIVYKDINAANFTANWRTFGSESVPSQPLLGAFSGNAT